MQQKLRTLYLSPEHDPRRSGKFVAYNLGTWDIDDLSNFDDVYAIALYIMSDLLRECTAIVPISYTRLKAPQKRLFFPNKTAKYADNFFADRIIASITEKKLNLEYCIKEYEKKSGWFKQHYKSLYVVSREADVQLLDILSGKTTGIGHDYSSSLTVYGYIEKDRCVTSCIEDYIHDLINTDDHLEYPNYAVGFFIEHYHSMLQITLNPALIPVDILLASIKTHVQNYGYTLEVQI